MRMGLFSSASWTGSAHRQALAQSCHLQPHALRRHPRQMRRMHLHACQASTPAQRPLPIHGSEMSSQCLETASSSRQGDAVEEPASPKPTPDAHTSRRQAIRMLAGVQSASATPFQSSTETILLSKKQGLTCILTCTPCILSMPFVAR